MNLGNTKCYFTRGIVFNMMSPCELYCCKSFPLVQTNCQRKNRVLTRPSGLPFNGSFLIVGHLEFPNFMQIIFFEMHTNKQIICKLERRNFCFRLIW